MKDRQYELFFISTRLMCTWRALFQVQALNTGSSTVVLVKELGLMLELPRILLNMYQVYTQVFFLHSLWLFSSGCHSSTISKHHWQCKPGCLWRQGVGSVLSFWRQFSIFLQFRLQVFNLFRRWTAKLLAEIAYIHHLDAQILSFRPDWGMNWRLWIQ